MHVSEITLYDILQAKFNKEEAKSIVENLKSTVDEQIDKRNVATKQDISELKQIITETKVDLLKWLFGFWVSLVLLILANWFLK